MEAVVFCGIQGTGKSTFCRQRFYDTHIRLNLDMLRTRHREGILLRACIVGKQRFVVDNTNPTAAERARYIVPARAARFRIVGYYFESVLSDAIERNARREGATRIPVPGILGAYRRLQVPTWAEGFDELYHVRIGAKGAFIVEPFERAEEADRLPGAVGGIDRPEAEVPVAPPPDRPPRDFPPQDTPGQPPPPERPHGGDCR